ncbi:MAG: hypothetical protein AAGI52_03430 [Bacteroidota bacterium]
MRRLLLVFLLAAATPAGAQVQTLVNGTRCTIDDAPERLDEPYLVVNTVGALLKSGGLPMDETETLTVYVVGEQAGLDAITVRRTSPTRDPDLINLAGGRAALDGISCDSESYEATDFAPGEGKVGLYVVDTSDNKLKLVAPEITFGVRAVYRGAISFGPLVSTLPERSYSLLEEGDALRLIETGGDLDMEYAISFTYYLTPHSRDESGPGLFVAIPVTGSLGESATAGFTFDLGTIFLLQAGVRLGRVDRIVAEQEDVVGMEVEMGFEPVTESVWKPGFVFGVSIDAASATRAFGKIVGELGGG